jgi:hypothetical protein
MTLEDRENLVDDYFAGQEVPILIIFSLSASLNIPL